MRRSFAILTAVFLMAFAAGCSPKNSSTSDAGSPADGATRVEITIDSTGFNPPTIQATAGQPLTLVFTRVTDQTCATSIKVPSQNITKVIPLNTPTEVSLAAMEKGDVSFACGMDMVTGVINVQ